VTNVAGGITFNLRLRSTLYGRLLRQRASIPFVATLLVVTSCSTLPVSATGNICNIFNTKPGWHTSALNMQAKWQVPVHVAMAIIFHESKFRRTAKPPRRQLLGVIPWKRRSSAYGYSQAIDGTWDTYITQTRSYGARRTNFDDSIDFVGWYMTKSADLAAVDKADAYNQYLAYHEGWTGYRNQSYKRKPWLLRVATDVVGTSQRYQQQYQRCSAT